MAGKSLGKIRQQLQLLLGEGIQVTLENFVNIAGNQYRQVVIAVRPKTVNEVQLVLRSCVSLKLKVRAVYDGMCLGPTYPEENQVALYTTLLKRHDGPRIELFQNDRDPTMSELAVMCNVPIAELIEFQLNNGIELPGNIIGRFSTVGGIISTMGHGSGLHVQTLSDLVVRIRIVDASGGLRQYDLTDPEMLNAAKGSLGLFGVIYDITFRVSPLSVVQVENRWMRASSVFYEKEFLSGLIHNNVSCQIFWWPYSGLNRCQRINAFFKKHIDERTWYPEWDEVWVRTINRPSDTPEEMPEHGMQWGTYWQGWSAGANKWFNSSWPSTTPFSIHGNITAMKKQFHGRVVQPVPYAIHFFGDYDQQAVWQVEFIFNHDTECNNIQTAIFELTEILKVAGDEGNYPFCLPVEIGFTGASTAYLSPQYGASPEAGGSGFSAYLKLTCFSGCRTWHQFCADLYKRLLKIPGIRPSWWHQWSFFPDINNIILNQSEIGIAKFRALHQKSGVDPGHIFFTERFKSIIYGTPQPINLNPDLAPAQVIAVDETAVLAQQGPPLQVGVGAQASTTQGVSTLYSGQPEVLRHKGRAQNQQEVVLVQQPNGVPQGLSQNVISQQGIIIQNSVPQNGVIKQGGRQQVVVQNGRFQQGIPNQGIPQQRLVQIQTKGGVANQGLVYPGQAQQVKVLR